MPTPKITLDADQPDLIRMEVPRVRPLATEPAIGEEAIVLLSRTEALELAVQLIGTMHRMLNAQRKRAA